jgi:two-component system OmpR family response regulator
MKRILVIEDEGKISRLLSLELSYEGYDVEAAFDGRTGLEKALNDKWDLILLDVMLPRLNGIEVLRRLRKNKNTPVVLLTARNDVSDKVTGLDQGANDYVTKPFDIEELFARIRAIFRNSHLEKSSDSRDNVLKVADIQLEKLKRDVTRNGSLIDLTSREFDLLLYFMENKNQVLTREQIIQEVWGFDYLGETNIVDVYVRYLRKKIDQERDTPLIQTYRGVGYSMKEQHS